MVTTTESDEKRQLMTELFETVSYVNDYDGEPLPDVPDEDDDEDGDDVAPLASSAFDFSVFDGLHGP